MTSNLTYNSLCVCVAMGLWCIRLLNSSDFLTERLPTLQYSSEIQSI